LNRKGHASDKITNWRFFYFLVGADCPGGVRFHIRVRLFPIYMDAYAVDTILKDVANESRGTDRSPNEVCSIISQRLEINDIDNIERDNFFYKTDRDATTIGIIYEARTELVGNLDAAATFERAETFN
jgi:hypothetical protein